MNLMQLEQVFPAYFKSGTSIEIQSSPGIGKSEFTYAQPARLSKLLSREVGLSTLFLATQTPTDLMGFMIPGVREDSRGVKRRVSEFTEPLWMTTVDGRSVSEYEYGILVLDEFGQGEPDTKRASAELLLNKGLGRHRLPPGWMVAALSNRTQDRSGVTKTFDFLINRRKEIHIEPDVSSWEKWAVANDIHPVFITFAVRNPQIVFESDVPAKQGPWCTPRSLVKLEQDFRAMADEEGKLPRFTDEHGRSNIAAMETAAGWIGSGAAMQMIQMIMLDQELPAYKDIVSHPTTAKVPKKADAQMLVCYQLASRVDDDTLAPIIQYVERMPEEFTITFGRSACARNNELVNTKAFGDWTRRNASLMMAIADRS